MYYIKVPDMNDSMSAISIDGVSYFLRFTYNSEYDYWSFGLYDRDKEPIIAMTKIVPNFPTLVYYNSADIPDGTFGCLYYGDEKDAHVGREAFNDLTAEFVYIPNSEVDLEEE